jgi:D-amino-acid dehydrogenase/Ca-activated chloride channel family protein
MAILTACSDEGEVWTSKRKLPGQEKQQAENDPMNKYRAATSIEGMLREGPGKYVQPYHYVRASHNDTTKSSNHAWPKTVLLKLRSIPPNLTAQEVYNRLIYMFAADYEPLLKDIANFDPKVPVSQSRKDKKAESPLQVNTVLVVDATSNVQSKVNSEETLFDLLKDKLKESISLIQDNNSFGFTQLKYSFAVYTYGGQVNKFSQLTPIEQAPQMIDSTLSQVRTGGQGTVSQALDQAKRDLQGQTSPNVLNQIYVISTGPKGLDEEASKKAKELLYSEAQVQVHTESYHTKDKEVERRLKTIADSGLGDFIKKPEQDAVLDIRDDSNLTGFDYKPREYKDFLNASWQEVMTGRKKAQWKFLDDIYSEEETVLLQAAKEVQMTDTERQLLERKIKERKERIKQYIQGKLAPLEPK